MELLKVTPDKEKARSILKMILLLEERIKIQDRNRMTALILTDYYEIVKELITALLLLDGYKTLSHKDLFEYFNKNYKTFSSWEIAVLDDLRVLRNRIAYDGFQVSHPYLDKNEITFKDCIRRLQEIIQKRI